MRAKKLFFNFGALAALISAPLAISACKTTSQVRDEGTIVGSEVLSEHSHTDCDCADSDAGCDCDHAECDGSCGGEGLESDSDDLPSDVE